MNLTVDFEHQKYLRGLQSETQTSRVSNGRNQRRRERKTQTWSLNTEAPGRSGYTHPRLLLQSLLCDKKKLWLSVTHSHSSSPHFNFNSLLQTSRTHVNHVRFLKLSFYCNFKPCTSSFTVLAVCASRSLCDCFLCNAKSDPHSTTLLKKPWSISLSLFTCF